MNKCRHPDCHNPAPHGQLYCSTKCYHTDPATLARLERQRLDALARLEQLRAEGRDPAHGGQAADRALTICLAHREWTEHNPTLGFGINLSDLEKRITLTIEEALAEQREADARVAERIRDEWQAIAVHPDKKEIDRYEAADRADTADTIAIAIRHQAQKGA